MKKHTLIQSGLGLSLAAFLVLSGCSPVAASANTRPTEPPGLMAGDPVALSTDAVTQEEADALRFMREEEKLAHDVYMALYETWAMPVFENIAAGEQTHTEAVLTLLDRYDVADPVGTNGPGVFTDPALQALYDTLVAQGSQSLSDALKVGAAIEEIDILDLEERSAQTDKADILNVYANLTRGSQNHLRAFVQTLARQTGETYVPQYLGQDAYDAIIGSTAGQGGRPTAPGNSRGGRGRR